jgi:hypothetical protein
MTRRVLKDLAVGSDIPKRKLDETRPIEAR